MMSAEDCLPSPEVCAAPEACLARIQMRERLVQLETRVVTDSLTGLSNRNHFDHVIGTEIDRSLRDRQPVSLIVLDIDHFKRVNDVFGHQAGDQVLREVARVARAAFRSADRVFRWGGEEFVVLVAGCGHRSAGRLAEALRARVAAHDFPVVGKVTVSLGVAEHVGGEGADEWFRRGDAMLYAAKRSGRNAVRIDAQGDSDVWASSHGGSVLHLAWQEGYECGEPTIDAEHRELFALANELLEAFLSGETERERIAPKFDRLLRHVVTHFADEEAVLERHGYARLEAHRRLHAKLLERAEELRAAVDVGEAKLGAVVEYLAADVVARHLFKADRDFFPLFAGPTEDAADSTAG